MKLALRKNFTDRTSTVYVVPDTTSVHSALSILWMEAGKLDAPFFVKVNGKIWLRSKWSEELPPEAFVEVFAAPGAGVDLAVVSLVLTIASLAYTAYLIANMPEAPNALTDRNLPDSENVFSFSGQKNITKLNQTVETTFGTNKWFPPYFTLPRIYFVENRAYIAMWFSLGNGLLEVDEVRCGDTLIGDIANSEWSIRTAGVPNEAHDCVYIGDKTNTELSAPDETNFETVTMIVTPSGALSSELQINLVFNAGLSRTVDIRWKYRTVDDLGRAQTPWAAWKTESFTASTTTPQRYTRNITGLTPARYEVAVERVTASGSERVTLISAYGLGYSGKGTPVNLLRVLLQGSNAIDESSASDISVVTTRLLPKINNGVWNPSPFRTRNPVWAIIEILRDCGITVGSLDLPYWEDLAGRVTENFDFVYTNKTTAWQALQDICACFRGQMFVVGSDFRVAVDTPEQTPVAFFGPDNATDLTWSVAFTQDTEEDAVEAVFVDPVTGLQSSVQFTPPGSSGTNPRSVTLAGVTDRTTAWRIAAYKYLSSTLLRDTVSFTAGMDGMIPMYGDLITVAWPFPAWAQAGLVYSQDGTTLTVSEELAADGGPNWVSLRNALGEMWGPVACTVGAQPNQIVLESALPVGMFDFEDFTREATLFTFGKSTTMEKVFRVTSLTPDSESVKIDAVAYDTAVFTYDVLQAPANDRIPVADPGISWSQVSIASTSFFRIVWPSVQGATSYTVKYIVYLDSAASDAYILDPASFPAWNIAPEVEAFGTTAYIPSGDNVNDRLVVQITASTGQVAYWRGMEAGEPLVLTLGSGFVAGAVRGTNGAFTFDAEDIEMVYKVDPAIGGNCTLAMVLAYTDAPNRYLVVPVSDTGYAVISAEVLRRTGFAGKWAWMRGIHVFQNGVVKIAADLTINHISVGVGMDNYVVETMSLNTVVSKLPDSMNNAYDCVYLKRRASIALVCNAIGEYETEWSIDAVNNSTVEPTQIEETEVREVKIDLWKFDNHKVTSITQREPGEGEIVFPNMETLPWLEQSRIIFVDSSDNQILPTTANSSFWLTYIPGDQAFGYYQVIVRGANSADLPMQSADFTNLLSADRFLHLAEKAPVASCYTNVKARLRDYYGGTTDWTPTLTVS